MSDEEIIEVVSALKANDKTMKDNGISDNLWGKAVECIMFLQSENAALHERLEKAVEFPFENLDKVFILAGEYTKAKQFIPDRIVEGTIVGFGYDIYEWVDGNYKFNYHVLVGENNYICALEQFNKTLFKTPDAATARLEELKGEAK